MLHYWDSNYYLAIAAEGYFPTTRHRDWRGSSQVIRSRRVACPTVGHPEFAVHPRRTGRVARTARVLVQRSDVLFGKAHAQFHDRNATRVGKPVLPTATRMGSNPVFTPKIEIDGCLTVKQDNRNPSAPGAAR